MFVLDTHHHVGSPGANGESVGGVDAREEVAKRLAVMDAEGVDAALVIPSHSYLRSNGIADTRVINDGIAKYRDANPDRFPVAACIAEPIFGGASLDEMRRCKEELGVVAVSLHARFQGVSMDDPSVVTIIERAIEIGLVPVLHAYPEDVDEALWRIVKVVRRLPPVPMLVLDAFATYESTMYCNEAADLCPNLVFDTALSFTFERIKTFVLNFGAERVMFGSDTYSVTPGQFSTHLLAQIRASSLPTESKALICGGNARRLFNLSGQSS